MFCKTVWHGLYILPHGDIRLCSIATNSKNELDGNSARDKDGNLMNILTHSIKDIMNSDKHCGVRTLNQIDPKAWSPHCNCCQVREQVTNHDRTHKNKSRRIYLNELIPTDNTATEENYVGTASKSGQVDWYPASLDIRFGNLCNQKCIMCSPEFSNLWYDDWHEWTGGRKQFTNGRPVNLIKNEHNKWVAPDELQWYEDPRWWPKFEEMAPHLRHIYVTGGEPMIVPAHDVMLDKLIEGGYAKNIVIEYDTNATVVNDKLANRWKHFKMVDIRVSMDAIEDQYELIRFGGKWEKFVKNIEKLKQYEKESNRQTRVSALTTCFQMTTAHTILKAEEWCKSVGVQFHIRFLEGPAQHRVLHLPKAAREELLEIYSNSDSEKAKMIKQFLIDSRNSTVSNPEHVHTFVKFMNFLDERRGTDWKTALPQLADMLTRYNFMS
jgi:pyruvate-formate lyase-activating enzyme